MPSQNNTGRQYDKRHATTVVAMAVMSAARFAAFNGTHSNGPNGARSNDVQGVTETAAVVGEAVSVITGYSALVEASGPIAFGEFVTPAGDGTGRAALGTVAQHCGRALGAASVAGELFEVQLMADVRAA